MDFERPIIELIPSKTDILLDRLALAGLIFLWAFVLYNYSRMPETIPTHYNGKGEIDGHGSKITMFILPGIVTFLFALLTVLNKYPHVFNYPVKISPDNAEQHYTSATSGMRYMKLIIVVIFIFISVDVVKDSHSGGSSLGWWSVPLFFILMCVPTLIYLYQIKRRSLQHNKSA